MNTYDNLRITARKLYDEATKRGIKVEILDAGRSMLRYQVNDTWRYTQGSVTDTSSPIGRTISDQKNLAALVAAENNANLPRTIQYTDLNSALEFMKVCKKIVVKPSDAAHGKGVSVDVTDIKTMKRAVHLARTETRIGQVLLQQQVEGEDLRLLVIGGKLVAASIRRPATVVSDGKSSIRQLIENENTSNDLRGENYRKSLNKIDIKAAEQYLGASIEHIAQAPGQAIRVTGTANIGTGGTATDVTDEIPQVIADQAAAIAKALRLDCCGVDYLASDVNKPSSYFFIEANASPSFGLHMLPTNGEPRDVASLLMDLVTKV